MLLSFHSFFNKTLRQKHYHPHMSIKAKGSIWTKIQMKQYGSLKMFLAIRWNKIIIVCSIVAKPFFQFGDILKWRIYIKCTTERCWVHKFYPAIFKMYQLNDVVCSLRWLNRVFLRLNSARYHCLPNVSINHAFTNDASNLKKKRNHFSALKALNRYSISSYSFKLYSNMCLSLGPKKIWQKNL